MHIQRLNIQRVRNLETVAIHQLQPFNIFCGENGSGKTSILEAIHILATGRSFRTAIPRHYIQHQATDALIFAQSDTDKIGVYKTNQGEQQIKVNGDAIATQGQLAKLLPLQFIEPLSTEVIDLGAKPRRQLLDWLMFHVEPEFYQVWLHYARVLKQRNGLLKSSRHLSLDSMAPWNKMLCDYGEILHRQRVEVVEQWKIYLAEELQLLLPELEIQLDYSPGFHVEQGLLDTLIQQHQRDTERRYTEYGPHRADLKFKTPQGDASTVLSRGQKKLLIIALKLAQIAMLRACNKETVVLLDDVTAELDLRAQQRLIKRLSQLGSQVFMTTLDQDLVENHFQDLSTSYQFFNVHAGQVNLASD